MRALETNIRLFSALTPVANKTRRRWGDETEDRRTNCKLKSQRKKRPKSPKSQAEEASDDPSFLAVSRKDTLLDMWILKEILAKHKHETNDCPVLLRLSPRLPLVRVELFTIRWVNAVRPLLPVRSSCVSAEPLGAHWAQWHNYPSRLRTFLPTVLFFCCLFVSFMHETNVFRLDLWMLALHFHASVLVLEEITPEERLGAVILTRRCCLAGCARRYFSIYQTVSVFSVHRAALLKIWRESVSCPSHVSFGHSVDKHRGVTASRYNRLLCSCLPSCG